MRALKRDTNQIYTLEINAGGRKNVMYLPSVNPLKGAYFAVPLYPRLTLWDTTIFSSDHRRTIMHAQWETCACCVVTESLYGIHDIIQHSLYTPSHTLSRTQATAAHACYARWPHRWGQLQSMVRLAHRQGLPCIGTCRSTTAPAVFRRK